MSCSSRQGQGKGREVEREAGCKLKYEEGQEGTGRLGSAAVNYDEEDNVKLLLLPLLQLKALLCSVYSQAALFWWLAPTVSSCFPPSLLTALEPQPQPPPPLVGLGR